MRIKHVIKIVDWEELGFTRVEWKLIQIPTGIYVKQLIQETEETTDWKVLAFSEWVDGSPALYLERGVKNG